MAEMSREMAATILQCETATTDYCRGECDQALRCAISALRRLDELERWVEDQTTGFALLSPSSSFSQKQRGHDEALREVLMYIRGQHPMQMPPEEEKKP